MPFVTESYESSAVGLGRASLSNSRTANFRVKPPTVDLLPRAIRLTRAQKGGLT